MFKFVGALHLLGNHPVRGPHFSRHRDRAGDSGCCLAVRCFIGYGVLVYSSPVDRQS